MDLLSLLIFSLIHDSILYYEFMVSAGPRPGRHALLILSSPVKYRLLQTVPAADPVSFGVVRISCQKHFADFVHIAGSHRHDDIVFSRKLPDIIDNILKILDVENLPVRVFLQRFTGD